MFLFFNRILLLIVVFMTNNSFGHPIENTLECYFDIDKVLNNDGYTCKLIDINIHVTKQTQMILITGIHRDQNTSSDVVNVKIFDSHTPFIVTEIFEKFYNITGLEIRKSSLARIQPFALSTAPNLKDIIIVENNIPILEHGSFDGLEKLRNLYLINNHIEAIEHGAFYGLENLMKLWMTNNRFTALEPTTFGSLLNLKKLIITHSSISRIDGQLFRNNTQLQEIILNDNKINEIEQNFIDDMEQLEILKLNDNICIDQDFIKIVMKITKKDLLNALDQCFDNFAIDSTTQSNDKIQVPKSNTKHRFTLEFEGKITIYDENGNVVYAN